MSGAFRFWKRFLHHNGTNIFNSKSTPTLVAATGWVVWKRVERQSETKKPSPCEQEFKDLERFYNRIKSPENLNHFSRKSYMRLERNLRTCAEANPGYFEAVSSDGSVKIEETPVSKEKVAATKSEPENTSKESLEERLQRLERNTMILGGKDVVVFLPKEEQELRSIARIPSSEVSEERNMLLPNGEINWRCTCIEREIIGPCNIEFRRFREHVHVSKRPDEDMTDEEMMAAREIIGGFLDCCRKHPDYYRSLFEDDFDEEDDEIYAEAEENYKKQQKELKSATAEKAEGQVEKM